MTCAKQFWKKMYTGWVMSIERQGNQGSTSPDTMCVVPYIAFYVSVCYFTKTRSNLLWFWWLQNLAVHTNTYMLYDQLFLILSHVFFHNAIALPVLKFIFNSSLFSRSDGSEDNHHPNWMRFSSLPSLRENRDELYIGFDHNAITTGGVSQRPRSTLSWT